MTARAVALHRRYELVVWWATPVEIASALARLFRMHQINSEDCAKASRLADRLAESWSVVQPSDSVRTRAIQLVGRYELRAADSVQLAAALECCAYSGLPMASAACELVAESMLGTTSPWLTDYLMHAFVMTLRWLGWEKETVRGATVQRRYYAADSEYLLDLCVQNGCKRLIVGTGPEIKRELFRGAGVTLVPQHWHGSTTLPGRDSILDAVARFSAADMLEKIITSN